MGRKVQVGLTNDGKAKYYDFSTGKTTVDKDSSSSSSSGGSSSGGGSSSSSKSGGSSSTYTYKYTDPSGNPKSKTFTSRKKYREFIDQREQTKKRQEDIRKEVKESDEPTSSRVVYDDEEQAKTKVTTIGKDVYITKDGVTKKYLSDEPIQASRVGGVADLTSYRNQRLQQARDSEKRTIDLNEEIYSEGFKKIMEEQALQYAQKNDLEPTQRYSTVRDESGNIVGLHDPFSQQSYAVQPGSIQESELRRVEKVNVGLKNMPRDKPKKEPKSFSEKLAARSKKMEERAKEYENKYYDVTERSTARNLRVVSGQEKDSLFKALSETGQRLKYTGKSTFNALGSSFLSAGSNLVKIAENPAAVGFAIASLPGKGLKLATDADYRSSVGKGLVVAGSKFVSDFKKNPGTTTIKGIGEFYVYGKAFKVASGATKQIVYRGKSLIKPSKVADPFKPTVQVKGKNLDFVNVMSEPASPRYLQKQVGKQISAVHVSQGGLKTNVFGRGKLKGFPAEASWRTDVDSLNTFFSSVSKSTGNPQAYLGYANTGIIVGPTKSSIPKFSLFGKKNVAEVVTSKVGRVPKNVLKRGNAAEINRYIAQNPGKLYVPGENIARMTTEGQYTAAASFTNPKTGFKSLTGTVFKRGKNLGSVVYREQAPILKKLGFKPAKTEMGKFLTNKYSNIKVREIKFLPGQTASNSISRVKNTFAPSNVASSSSAPSVTVGDKLIGLSSKAISSQIKPFSSSKGLSSSSSQRPFRSSVSSSQSSSTSSLSSASSFSSSFSSSLSSLQSSFSSSSLSSSPSSPSSPSSSLSSSSSKPSSSSPGPSSPSKTGSLFRPPKFPGTGKMSPKSAKSKSLRQKKRYTPSATAVIFNIKGKAPKEKSGLAFRPILSR